MSKPSPDFDQFSAIYNQGKPQVVWTKRIEDIETPISASLKLKEEGKPFFLLESVEGGKIRGRYSLIGLSPDLIWKCDDTHAYMSIDQGPFEQDKLPPIESLKALHQQSLMDTPEALPPTVAGLIGYMGYDAIRFLEPSIPSDNPDHTQLPTGYFMRPQLVLTFDSVTQNLYVLSPIYPKPGLSAKDAYTHATNAINGIFSTLDKPTSGAQRYQEANPIPLSFQSNMSRERFHDMVHKAKEYIMAGDIFQVVPSQRFTADYSLPAFAFYRSLRQLNPSPFLFFMDFGPFQLAGSSPEIMVRLRDNKVVIRPLAGTRKRGKTQQEDQALTEELLQDKKEIAEHLMLVDLSRNDVGRVAKPGTVQVTEKFKIEYYSHVMHISSTVEGELADGYSALDALFAGLPVGTVSGAPKIRAMQIIDELEPEKRGYYAGCVGYLSADGSMDTCITLRTALIKDQKLIIQAGCGVVADSDAESEYQETLNKAEAIMQAARHSCAFANTANTLDNL